MQLIWPSPIMSSVRQYLIGLLLPLLLLLLSLLLEDCKQSSYGQVLGSPLDAANLRAVLRLDTYISERLISSRRVQEHYSSLLSAADVRVKSVFVTQNEPRRFERFLFQGLELAIQLDENHFEPPIGLTDFEDGGLVEDFHQIPPADWVRPLPDQLTISSNLLKVPDQLHVADKPLATNLNLNDYISPECLEKEQTSSHIRGLVRLLRILECWHHKFHLTEHNLAHPEPEVTVYSLRDLQPVSETPGGGHFGPISVSAGFNIDAGPAESTLPMGSIPSSIRIRLLNDKLEFVLTIHGLQILPAGQAFVNYAQLFSIPIGLGVSSYLKPVKRITSKPKISSLSFKASLRQDRSPLLDPPEISVSFNAKTSTLACQTALVDRTSTRGLSWTRYLSLLLLDGRTQLRHHFRPSYEDYQLPAGMDEMPAWDACRIDAMSREDSESLAQRTLEAFTIDESALFLGLSTIRGIPCRVFERQLDTLPAWLNLESSTSSRARFFATIFVEASTIGPINEGGGNSIKPLGLVIDSIDEGRDKQQMRLEIFQFSWTESTDNRLNILDYKQECLLLGRGSRHIEVELSLQLTKGPDELKISNDDKNSLNYLKSPIERTLAQLLDVSVLQLVELSMELRARSSSLLDIRFSIWEPARLIIKSQPIECPKIESTSTTEGSTSLSLDECRWLAAHSLLEGSTHDRKVVYFPDSRRCILLFEDNEKILKPQNEWNLPVGPSGDPREADVTEVCLGLSVSLRWQPHELTFDSSMGRTGQQGAMMMSQWQLDWLTSSQSSYLKHSLHLDVGCISGQLLEIRISNAYDGERPNQLKPIKRLGLSENTESIHVSSLADCGQICLQTANCGSYSLCHHSGRLLCTWSFFDVGQLDQTAQEAFNKLRELAERMSSLEIAQHRHQSIQVLKADSEQVSQVSFMLSSLCTLYHPDRIELFRRIARGSPNEAHFRNSSKVRPMVLKANSREECARFCMERGKMFTGVNADDQIEESRGRIHRDGMCFGFEYRTGECRLIPDWSVKQANELLEGHLKLKGTQTDRTSRWSRSILAEQRLLQPEKQAGELFELDYERLFVAHRDMRLKQQRQHGTSLASGSVSGSEFPLWLSKRSARDCARMCLQLAGCRSFDLLEAGPPLTDGPFSQTIGPLSGQGSCVLHSIELLSAGADMTPATSQPGWWHFEPSSLGLWMTEPPAA